MISRIWIFKKSLVEWPKSNDSTGCYLEIKATSGGGRCGLRSNQYDLWDNAIDYRGYSSSLGFPETPVRSQVLVYPNPTIGITFINPGVKTDKLIMSISDFSGKEIVSSSNTYSVDFSVFHEGYTF